MNKGGRFIRWESQELAYMPRAKSSSEEGYRPGAGVHDWEGEQGAGSYKKDGVLKDSAGISVQDVKIVIILIRDLIYIYQSLLY